MFNEFNEWNRAKKSLSAAGHDSLFLLEGEIWWCSLGLNIGSEQNGKNENFERPVIVIKIFNNQMAWILPLTSKEKSGRYYHLIREKDFSSTVILSQIRLVSVKRFRRIICIVSESEFLNIRTKVVNLLINKTSN